MNWSFSRLCLVAILLPFICLGGDHSRTEYPPARVMNQVDTYHGVQVRDPYRWLEDPDSDETKRWVVAEKELTESYLGRVPQREQIRQRLTQLWDYERRSLPYQRGKQWFYFRNTGLQAQSVFYVAQGLNDPNPRILIDPNTFSADGTIALAEESVNKQGSLVAYAISQSGTDWREVRIRNVATGVDLQETLNWIKFSEISWSADGDGFYYSRYPSPIPDNLQGSTSDQKLYYHKIGTPQAQDKLVYERPDHPGWFVGGSATEDGRYLLISTREGTDSKNRMSYVDLTQSKPEIRDLFTSGDANYSFVANKGSLLWFLTNLNAPRRRIISVDLRYFDTGVGQLKEVVPETENVVDEASLVGGHLILSYLKDAHALTREFDLKGQFIREVSLPGLGTAHGFGGETGDRYTTYSFEGFTVPRSIYQYDTKTGRSDLVFQPSVGSINPDDYQTEQVFYSSKDGTQVPMFIVYKKTLQRNGNNPIYLTGYGGFNISMLPNYSAARMAWLEMGGIFALANLRGGGEYGEQWHEAGRLLNKQHVFDDFVAAAHWLVDNGYTRPEKLSIGGGSNGGLLVGAAITQHPELFAAAVPEVGVLDMLRFHLWTAGRFWVPEYGSVDNQQQFNALLAYSPLHNVKKGVKYPATFVMTADHDDRVVPAHSFKFAATLQAAQGSCAPILIRIETKAGHGGGITSTQKRIEETTDKWSFLVQELGMNPSFTK